MRKETYVAEILKSENYDILCDPVHCEECEQAVKHAEVKLLVEEQRLICPHGDPSCPCKDGDSCHYEGENPMTPPMKLLEQHLDVLTSILRKMVNDDAFAELCAGIGEEPSWLKEARAALAVTDDYALDTDRISWDSI